MLIAVHPRHARLYQRFFKLEPVGEVREYPQVSNHPAVALCLDFAKLESDQSQVYRNLFCHPIPAGALNSSPMSTEERTYLGPIASFYDASRQAGQWSRDGVSRQSRTTKPARPEICSRRPLSGVSD